uniref:Uncharacterized protein n=1 Tax=Anopheles coluzzii TaxID=1518534 RepID=A0A8W7PYA3_ANOCL
MSHYACEALERTGGALYASVIRKQAKVKTFANFRQAPLEVVARASDLLQVHLTDCFLEEVHPLEVVPFVPLLSPLCPAYPLLVPLLVRLATAVGCSVHSVEM